MPSTRWLSRGGRLLIRSREATEWKTERKGIVLTVADTGCGMSQQTLTRIFEPFFTTKSHKGNGIGLWISRGIVDRHHGLFAVRSRCAAEHSGTVFAFFLPVNATTRD